MNNTYGEVVLDERTREYILRCMANGAVLSKAVLRLPFCKTGPVTAVLPIGIQVPTGQEFRHTFEGLNEELAKGHFIEIMARYLCESRSHLIVFPNVCFKSTAEYIMRWGDGLRLIGEEVYHVLLPSDSQDSEQMWKVMYATANRWSHMCYFTRLETSRLDDDEAWMKEVCDNTTAIGCGAFDTDTFLILRSQ